MPRAVEGTTSALGHRRLGSTLLARVFDEDGFACPTYGERMAVGAVVRAPGAMKAVAGLKAALARGSPVREDAETQQVGVPM